MAEANGRAGRQAEIPISKIRENQVALRPVERDTEKFLGLVESVKQKGILNPVVVREVEDPENPGEKLYGLIDGLHRYTAAMEAGLKTIPVNIRDMDQAEIEEVQIIANLHKVDTKPVQFTKQLERLMARNPLMTLNELAGRLSATTKWLSDRFGLLKLTEPIQELVDDSKIKLANAYQLAKLPPDEQPNWVDRAMTQDLGGFTAAVAQRVKELREARAQGRPPGPTEFQPQPHQRKWAEVKQEQANRNLSKTFTKKHGATTAEQGWDLALDWVANMDPDSKAAQIIENKAREDKATAEKERKKKEKEEQKQKDAAQARAAVSAGSAK